MRSILKQLAKYLSPEEKISPIIIEIKQKEHPYQSIVESICDIANPLARKRAINDALLALNDFVPPPMTNQLYPLEIAVLYHLFYRYRIIICSDSYADVIFGRFLKSTAEENGGLSVYMKLLRSRLDKNSTMIFLYRVILAAFGERSKHDLKRDHINKEFGYKAAKTLGIEASARVAGNGLDSLSGASVEQLILGRITYIAFWEWSRTESSIECNQYLALPSGDIGAHCSNHQKPATPPPYQF